MLGEEAPHHLSLGLPTRSKTRQTRGKNQKASKSEGSAVTFDAPILRSQSQKENQATPSITKAAYPTPSSSVNSGVFSNSKRKLVEIAENDTERQIFKKAKLGLDKERTVLQEHNLASNTENLKGGGLSDLSENLPSVDFPSKSTKQSFNSTKWAKPSKTRKLRSDPKKSDLGNRSQVDLDPTCNPEDPLQCNETISIFYLRSNSSCNYEKSAVPAISTGPSGIATPTKFNITQNDINKNLFTSLLFERLENGKFEQRISSMTGNSPLIIDPKPAFELEKNLSADDLPLFNSLLEVWIDNIKRESYVAEVISPDCLDTKRDIGPMERWLVVNWIREISSEHRFSRQSFHAAVQYLDLCLTKFDIEKESLQIIGVAALLVAIKANDTSLFGINLLLEFIWDEENRTPEQNVEDIKEAEKYLLKYEYKIVSQLKWDLYLPTPLDFLRHSFQFAAIADGGKQFNSFPDMYYDSLKMDGHGTVMHQKFDTLLFVRAVTILDNLVLDYESLKIPGSQMAAGVFWKIYPVDDRSHEGQIELLRQATGYDLDQIQDALNMLEPYHCSVEDVHASLNSVILAEVAQNMNEGEAFRMEEHQMPSEMKDDDYMLILEKKSQQGRKGRSFH